LENLTQMLFLKEGSLEVMDQVKKVDRSFALLKSV
jgi:hypothetical protein